MQITKLAAASTERRDASYVSVLPLCVIQPHLLRNVRPQCRYRARHEERCRRINLRDALHMLQLVGPTRITGADAIASFPAPQTPETQAPSPPTATGLNASSCPCASCCVRQPTALSRSQRETADQRRCIPSVPFSITHVVRNESCTRPCWMTIRPRGSRGIGRARESGHCALDPKADPASKNRGHSLADSA